MRIGTLIQSLQVVHTDCSFYEPLQFDSTHVIVEPKTIHHTQFEIAFNLHILQNKSSCRYHLGAYPLEGCQFCVTGTPLGNTRTAAERRAQSIHSTSSLIMLR